MSAAPRCELFRPRFNPVHHHMSYRDIRRSNVIKRKFSRHTFPATTYTWRDYGPPAMNQSSLLLLLLLSPPLLASVDAKRLVHDPTICAGYAIEHHHCVNRPLHQHCIDTLSIFVLLTYQYFASLYFLICILVYWSLDPWYCSSSPHLPYYFSIIFLFLSRRLLDRL